MDPDTKFAFYECLERITSYDTPDDDPDILRLRDYRYPGGYSASFQDGIIVFTGPHLLPPIAFMELVDLAWMEGEEWAD